MGYWGEGLLDSDYAADALNHILAPWVKAIEKLSGKPESAQWDEFAADELTLRIHILLLLHREKYPLENFPKSEILKSNRPKFESGWISYAEGNEYQLKRLKKILEIWDKLVEISEDWEQRIA